MKAFEEIICESSEIASVNGVISSRYFEAEKEEKNMIKYI